MWDLSRPLLENTFSLVTELAVDLGTLRSHDAVTLWSRSPGAGWPPVRLLVVRVQEPGVEAEALPVHLLGEGVQLLLQRRVLQVQTLKLLLYQTEQFVQFGPETRKIFKFGEFSICEC